MKEREMQDLQTLARLKKSSYSFIKIKRAEDKISEVILQDVQELLYDTTKRPELAQQILSTFELIQVYIHYSSTDEARYKKFLHNKIISHALYLAKEYSYYVKFKPFGIEHAKPYGKLLDQLEKYLNIKQDDLETIQKKATETNLQNHNRLI